MTDGANAGDGENASAPAAAKAAPKDPWALPDVSHLVVGVLGGTECVPAPALGASVNGLSRIVRPLDGVVLQPFQHVGPPVQHFVADVNELRPRSQIALLCQCVDGGPQEIGDLRQWTRP
jgi:hypothetical protein